MVYAHGISRRRNGRRAYEVRVDRILRNLRRDFVVVGENRVKSWNAWLAIGLAAGIAAGILFVAARSGEFSESGAAVIPPPPPTPVWAFRDDFNRPNSTALGNGWQEVNGDLLIQNDELVNAAGAAGPAIAIQPVAVSDQTAQASFASTNNAANPVFGFVLGYQDAENHYRLYRKAGSPSQLRISIVEKGIEKVLAQTNVPNPIRNSKFRLAAYLNPKGLTLSIVGGKSITAQNSSFMVGSVGILMGSLANSPRLLVSHRADDFTASGTLPPPSITVLSPNGGEVWERNNQITDTLSGSEWQPITWAPDPMPTDPCTVDAYLERDVNGRFETVGKIPAFAWGSISWVVGIVAPVGSNICWVGSTANLTLVDFGQYYVRLVDKATGASDRSDKSFSIVPAPSVKTTSNLQGVVGQSFSAVFEAVEPTGQLNPPYTWAVTNGNLPPGLTLAVPTAPPCQPGGLCQPPPPPPPPNLIWLSGVPTQAGQYGFELTVTNGLKRTGTALFFSVISPPPPPSPFTVRMLPEKSPFVLPGTKGVHFGTALLDAADSPEDVMVLRLNLEYQQTGTAPLTNCILYDGPTALNSGSDIVNPWASGSYVFTLGSPPVVAHGSVKEVELKCDVPQGAAAQDTYLWSLEGKSANVHAVGVPSGKSIIANVVSSSGPTVTVVSATFSASLDPSSPALALAQAGTEVPVAVFRLSASNDSVDVKQMAFKLSNTHLNSPSDIVKISLWDGATKVGEVTATSSDSGLVMAVSGLIIPENSDKLVTLRAQLASIGLNEAGHPGNQVTLDWDQVNINGNPASYGVGMKAGQTVFASGQDTQSEGVRMFRAFPTLATHPVPSTHLANGSMILYRFSVASPSGANGASLYKFTFNIATSTPAGNTMPVTSFQLFAFTSPWSGGAYNSSGQLNNGSVLFSTEGGNDGIEENRTSVTDYAIYFNPVNDTSSVPEAIAIPPLQTYYFELRGNVSGAVSGSNATIQLLGDVVFSGTVPGPVPSGNLPTAAAVDAFQDDDFIWSGNSTTTHSGASGASGPDWSNGHLIPGLPASGATPVTFTL